MLTVYRCKSKDCGKTFSIPARISEEQKPAAYANYTRRIVEKAACPYCEGTDIEEIRGI